MSWRVWLAFETRPGITITSMQDKTTLWRSLVEACRDSSGRINRDEYMYWMTFLVEHAHLWGEA